MTRSRLFQHLKNSAHGQLIERYAARLVKDGLARQSTWRCLNVVGGLLSWIAGSRFKLTSLDERMAERYLQHRGASRSNERPSGAEAVLIGAARSLHRCSRRSHRMTKSEHRDATGGRLAGLKARQAPYLQRQRDRRVAGGSASPAARRRDAPIAVSHLFG